MKRTVCKTVLLGWNGLQNRPTGCKTSITKASAPGKDRGETGAVLDMSAHAARAKAALACAAGSSSFPDGLQRPSSALRRFFRVARISQSVRKRNGLGKPAADEQTERRSEAGPVKRLRTARMSPPSPLRARIRGETPQSQPNFLGEL